MRMRSQFHVAAAVAVGLWWLAGCGCSAPQPPAPEPSAGSPAVSMPARVAAGDRPILVTFTKPGCPACLKLAPALAELRREYGSTVQFEDVDIKEATKLVIDYGIRLTPTLIVFLDGAEKSRLENPKPEAVREALDAAIAARS